MRVAALICALTAFGCSSHKSGDDSGSATLVLSPATSTLVLNDGAPASESFTATLMTVDGSAVDVTAQTLFGVDEELGSFVGATLTMSSAGPGSVNGLYMDEDSNNLFGSASVIAQLSGVRIDPSLGSDTPGLFSGATEDPTRAPTVVYPPQGVVVPRNLGDFEVHWTDASSNNVWEVSLQDTYVDLKVYVPGGNGTGGGPDPSWMSFLPTEWLAAVGNSESMTYQVRGADSTMPGTVGSAPPESVDLSNTAMNGGIYYWSTGGTGSDGEGIWRHDMSKPQTPATAFYTGAQLTNPTQDACIACHVLSSDGTKMAVTFQGGNGSADEIDVASQTFQGDTNYWNFATYTPDGTQLLAVEAGNLVVRDQATQTVIGSMTSAGWVTHPNLSADGTMLVYVRPTVMNCDWAFGGGEIVTRTYDQASASFGAENVLLQNSMNNYYPSFSPDGQWIVFNQSTDNSTSGAYNNPSATVWVIKSDGSQPPVELAAMNTSTANLTNSWPRWAPFAQSVGANMTPIYWITMSSKRDFGVRLVGKAQPQLWMSPFFPGQATMGMDPSAPAFWLPFQNIDSSNHIAQWTQQVIGLQ
jgi:hypothetical protein